MLVRPTDVIVGAEEPVHVIDVIGVTPFPLEHLDVSGIVFCSLVPEAVLDDMVDLVWSGLVSLCYPLTKCPGLHHERLVDVDVFHSGDVGIIVDVSDMFLDELGAAKLDHAILQE